jgi:hypothetical protein
LNPRYLKIELAQDPEWSKIMRERELVSVRVPARPKTQEKRLDVQPKTQEKSEPFIVPLRWQVR